MQNTLRNKRNTFAHYRHHHHSSSSVYQRRSSCSHLNFAFFLFLFALASASSATLIALLNAHIAYGSSLLSIFFVVVFPNKKSGRSAFAHSTKRKKFARASFNRVFLLFVFTWRSCRIKRIKTSEKKAKNKHKQSRCFVSNFDGREPSDAGINNNKTKNPNREEKGRRRVESLERRARVEIVEAVGRSVGAGRQKAAAAASSSS